MIIIPALYLSRGNAVSHYKGQAEEAVVLSRDPLQTARGFEKEGARSIHLVDLDAVDGGSEQNRLVAKSIAQKTQLKVSCAGGIASLEDIARMFDDGIDYVSLDQFSEHLLADALKKFGPDRMFFTIITLRNVVEGKPGIDVMDYGSDLAEKGVTHIILRDIKAEGSLHPNFDEVEKLIIGTGAEIFAFGGIGAMDDLDIMKRTGAAGVMVSKALISRRLSLSECMRRFGA